jgi:hypothetical protein
VQRSAVTPPGVTQNCDYHGLLPFFTAPRPLLTVTMTHSQRLSGHSSRLHTYRHLPRICFCRAMARPAAPYHKNALAPAASPPHPPS